jgi:hypothetical protein
VIVGGWIAAIFAAVVGIIVPHWIYWQEARRNRRWWRDYRAREIATGRANEDLPS